MLKKMTLGLGLLVAVATMISCDPGFDDYVCLRNQSGHDLVITTLDSNARSEAVRVSKDSVCILARDGGIGSSSRSNCEWLAREAYGDSLAIRFDIGSLVYHAVNDTLDGPYAMHSKRYEYVEKTSENNHAFEGRLICTVTAEDYHALVAGPFITGTSRDNK